MIFAPHILQVKVITPMDKDEFGRPIPGTGGESWQEVCKCRCDDVSAEKKVSINGALYDFKYKVVFDKPSKVEAGADVLCPGLLRRGRVVAAAGEHGELGEGVIRARVPN